MTKVIYLAGTRKCPDKFGVNVPVWRLLNNFNFHRLESYPYAIRDVSLLEEAHRFKSFLFDSGAFSFMSGMDSSSIDWDRYVHDYAATIVKYGIKHFMELDIDSIVGLREVERMRASLERMVEIPSVPVWHIGRGIDEWRKIISIYKRVAIGGLVTNEISKNDYKILPRLIAEAAGKDVRVHGLGVTDMNTLKNVPFSSVDSTSWLASAKYGGVWFFNGSWIKKIPTPTGKRSNGNTSALISMREWIRFANHMEGVA